jgi:Right handed beta helix region
VLIVKIRTLPLSLLALSSCTLSVTQVAPRLDPSGRSPDASTAVVLGLGKTTATCIDKDGDGYGLGPGCANGPDADDNDPSVRTAKDVLAKYGSMRAFLNHHIQETLGNPNYAVRKIVYLDAQKGRDFRGKANDENRPYRSFNAIAHSLRSGDVVLFRAGAYPRMSPTGAGSGFPVVYMAYPGEVVRVDASSYEAFALLNASGLILDGFLIYSSYPTGGSQCISGGSWWSKPITGPPLFHDVIIQNFDCANCSRGMLIQNGLLNLIIQDSVIHDMPYGRGTHPVYLGSDAAPSRNVIVRRNLVFNSGAEGNGVQFNGRVTNLVVDSNIIYNSEGAGISLLQGVSNSLITDNLIFNHANGGIKIMNYPSGSPYILAYDQTGNVIENNTIWQGTNDWYDGEAITSSPIYVFHAGGLKAGNLGGNIFRNNILVTSFGAGAPAIDFRDADRPDELQTSTFQNNIVWSTTVTNVVAANGPRKYDCAQFVAATTHSSGCVNSKPLFADVHTGYYKQPLKFDFMLRAGSPAIGAGTPTGAPSTDLKGVARPNPPSIGAYEYPQ